MAEQQIGDLLERVIALEKQNRRMKMQQTFFAVMVVALVYLSVGGNALGLRGYLEVGHPLTDPPGISLRADGGSGSLRLASSRDTATAWISTDRSEGASSSLWYDGTGTILAAEKDSTSLELRGNAGEAHALASSQTTGFYLYDKDDTLRAELSLVKQEPALIFYDAKGKELRRLRATEK